MFFGPPCTLYTHSLYITINGVAVTVRLSGYFCTYFLILCIFNISAFDLCLVID